MGNWPPIRVRLKFGVKDEDLKLLANDEDIKALVKTAIDHYLGDKNATISLTPKHPQKHNWTTFSIRYEEDPQIYQFIRKIPEGNRTAVIKLLLRHAMEQCDIRHLLRQQPSKAHAPQKPPRESLREAPRQSAATSAHSPVRVSQFVEDSDETKQDNIFDFI